MRARAASLSCATLAGSRWMKPRRRCRSRGRRWIGSGGRRGRGCIRSSLMDPDRWQRVTAIFEAALLREPTDRVAYVTEACGAEPGLLADVQALLAGNERAKGASSWSGTGPMGPTAPTLQAG